MTRIVQTRIRRRGVAARGVRSKLREREPVASGGSCSRSLLLNPTGRFAAGAGCLPSCRRARATRIRDRDPIRVIRAIRG
jgi:hypothetical protein